MSHLTAVPLTSGLVPLSRLPQEFRDNAATVRILGGSEDAGHVWELAARVVEERLANSLLEPLTLEAAVLESGYTRSHLHRMLREGTVPNSGADADPRILRMHLPRKPGHGVDVLSVQPASSRVQAARAVIEGEQ